MRVTVMEGKLYTCAVLEPAVSLSGCCLCVGLLRFLPVCVCLCLVSVYLSVCLSVDLPVFQGSTRSALDMQTRRQPCCVHVCTHIFWLPVCLPVCVRASLSVFLFKSVCLSESDGLPRQHSICCLHADPQIAALPWASTRPPLEECSKEDLLDDIRRFLEHRRGKVLLASSFPEAVLNGKQLDLNAMYRTVCRRGGFAADSTMNWGGKVRAMIVSQLTLGVMIELVVMIELMVLIEMITICMICPGAMGTYMCFWPKSLSADMYLFLNGVC